MINENKKDMGRTVYMIALVVITNVVIGINLHSTQKVAETTLKNEHLLYTNQEVLKEIRNEIRLVVKILAAEDKKQKKYGF